MVGKIVQDSDTPHHPPHFATPLDVRIGRQASGGLGWCQPQVMGHSDGSQDILHIMRAK
jgi:hypothetical protein